MWRGTFSFVICLLIVLFRLELRDDASLTVLQELEASNVTMESGTLHAKKADVNTANIISNSRITVTDVSF